MRLTDLRIFNYKCFRESGNIHFDEGFNVIVGPNSSGKTALLEVLLNQGLKNEPHRSQTFGGPRQVLPNSWAEMDIVLSGTEIQDAILRGGSALRIPVPPSVASDEVAAQYLQTNLFAEHRQTKFQMARTAGAAWTSKLVPAHGLFEIGPQGRSVSVGPSADRQSLVINGLNGKSIDQLAAVAAGILSTVYVFRAERLNIGRSPIAPDVPLSPDAGNLPTALHMLLARNPHQFDRLNKLVRQVLPTIERFTVVPVSANEVEIRVWSTGYKEEREDLAIPIAACGTGVGQVLAILYLAVTSREPRTIVIDEPSSFLHPSATRELLEVLRSEGRHQYILSTHAPEVISAADPKTLTVLRWSGSESTVAAYVGADVTSMRVALQEVGARLSDVFGLDRVVWVEGPTEAASFPEVVRFKRGRMPTGAAFVPIVNTGDLERRGHYSKLVGQVYRQLTVQSALMPQTIAMSLDREDRSEGDRVELAKAVGCNVYFLPRRSLENYLLHAAAIAEVINTCGAPQAFPAQTAIDVANWFAQHSADARYKSCSTSPDPLSDLQWIENVDAPRLLADFFAEATDHKVEFRKVEHSLALLKWLLANDPDHLDELVSYVANLVPS